MILIQLALELAEVRMAVHHDHGLPGAEQHALEPPKGLLMPKDLSSPAGVSSFTSQSKTSRGWSADSPSVTFVPHADRSSRPIRSIYVVSSAARAARHGFLVVPVAVLVLIEAFEDLLRLLHLARTRLTSPANAQQSPAQ